MKADPLLPLYREQYGARAGRDRLGLLTALIDGPAFDPLFRGEVIRIPARHPVFRWACLVAGCARPRKGSLEMCHVHYEQWAQAQARGKGMAAFLAAAQPLGPSVWVEQVPCRICPGRPATHTGWRLCHRHYMRWYRCQRSEGQLASFGNWLAGQVPFDGYGPCQVAVCPDLAATPLGLCAGHESRYQTQGRPGGAALPPAWSRRYEARGLPVPVALADQEQFRAWCAAQPPVPWPGQIILAGLAPLPAAEIRWGLFAHTQRERHTRWDTGWVQALVNTCRTRGTGSLTELDLSSCTTFAVLVAREILHDLRLAYFTPEASRDAGFIETDHFGVRFPERGSHFDLTGIAQRWLRDLLWDYLADLLRSPGCPRTGGTFDAFRRAATELGAFLALDAPGGGHDPAQLAAAHIQRFAADQRHREREGLASLVMRRQDGTPSVVTTTTRAITFNHARKLLRWALDCGAAERIGLSRQFITAMPAAGPTPLRKRSPFPDEVARALADEASLARLAEVHDPADFGLRDIWETIIVTGRRVSEVLQLRLDCTGRYGGLAMLWHDQTKVGRYDQAIRIPESLTGRLAARGEITVSRFIARHGRAPTAAERAAMALFPGRYRNPDGTAAVTYQWFHLRFRAWVDELDIGRWVPHQARHTLPTSLLRHGATLSHIRRYLGHVSDRMAEHYIQLVPLRPRGRPAARVGRRAWYPQPRRAAVRARHAADPRASPGARDRPVQAQHPCRRRVLHLPAGRRRRRLPVEPGLPQLRQLRALRRRPALLAAQTRAVVLHRRTCPRRRHRQLAARRLRADRGRDRRAGSRPGRARPARRRARPGPAPPPGLLPAGLEHRVPRHRARQRHRRHRPRPR